jgi:hypothetical protein
MISLHSIMATGSASNLPMIVGIMSGIMLALAFIVGFVKGFRKVSWDGLIWATAAGLFSFVGFLIEPTGMTVRRVAIIILFTLLYIVAALAVYGLLAHYLRPKIRWVKDDVNGDTTLAEYGLEFEPEYLDYDGEDDPRPYGKRLYKTGFNPPSLFGRLLGGFACFMMVFMIFWSVLAVVLLGINATSLANMNIGAILQNKTMGKLLNLAKLLALDWICIGFIFMVAKKGFSVGLMNSLRGIFVSLGSLALIGVCFYLPFSSLATRETGMFYFLTKLSNRCAVAMSRFPLSEILGKLVTGGILAAVAGTMMFFFNILLKKCCNLVSATAPTRIVDQVLSCGLYLIIAVMICIGVWFGFAALEHIGILNISEILHKDAYLSNGLFTLAQKLVGELAAAI